MGPVVADCIDVTLHDASADLSPWRPRLQRLAWSLPFVLAAILVWGWPSSVSWWDEARYGDIHLTGALLLIAGAVCALPAIAGDLCRLHRVCIGARGLHLEWSHVPRLTGPRVALQRFVGWDEVAAIAWLEGAQDYDFRQYIVLRLREPVAPPLTSMKLPVSDGRDRERCEALASRLPPGVALPRWLDEARARRAELAVPSAI